MAEDSQKPTSGALASLVWLVAGVGLVGLTLVDQRGLVFPRRNAPPTAMIAIDEPAETSPMDSYVERPSGLFRSHTPRLAGLTRPAAVAGPLIVPGESGPPVVTAPVPPFEDYSAVGGPVGDDIATPGGGTSGYQPIGFGGGGFGGIGGGGVLTPDPAVTDPPTPDPPAADPPAPAPAPPIPAVPEPSLWMLMIGGVAMLGGALRRRRFIQARDCLRQS